MSEREDLLLGRVAERTAGAADWDELEARGAVVPELWERLALRLRDDDLLRAAVEPVLAIAEHVDVDVDVQVAAAPAAAVPAAWSSPWVGWAAALLIAAAWAWSSVGDVASPQSAAPAVSEHAAGNGVESDAGSEAMVAEEAAADVVGELPKLLVSTTPTADGEQLEVLYVRRVLERSFVRHVYELGTDDLGQPVPNEVSRSWFQQPESF